MEKEHKYEEIAILFNKSINILQNNKVFFKDWNNLNRIFEQLMSKNIFNLNYILKYATILYSSEVIFYFKEDEQIYKETKAKLEKLIEKIIINKHKDRNYDERKEIYEEIYLQDQKEKRRKIEKVRT